MNAEIFALACPDWIGPTFVLAPESREIAYGNWGALALLGEAAMVRAKGKTLQFVDVQADVKFEACIDDMLGQQSSRETFFFRSTGNEDWITVRLHRPRGLSREILTHRLREGGRFPQVIFVEVAAPRPHIDADQLRALAHSFALNVDEIEHLGHIAQRRTLRDIAQNQRLPMATVARRHRHVMSKTGCQNRSELLSLVLSAS